jgi:hypothetical protein
MSFSAPYARIDAAFQSTLKLSYESGLLTEPSDRSAKDSNDGSLGVRLLALDRKLPLHVDGSQAPSRYEHETTAMQGV